ncbi:hypothetical protein, partial [Streptomyces wuyuanensis]|uniref:hypothetical protein n=1 Tax=Streptomyces wuyuanensis TaxID=1196353 RepID=UPI0034417CB5
LTALRATLKLVMTESELLVPEHRALLEREFGGAFSCPRARAGGRSAWRSDHGPVLTALPHARQSSIKQK